MVACMEIFLPLTWVDEYLVPYNVSSVTILRARDKEGVLPTEYLNGKNPVLCLSSHIFQHLQVAKNCEPRVLPEWATFGSIHALTWGTSQTKPQTS